MRIILGLMLVVSVAACVGNQPASKFAYKTQADKQKALQDVGADVAAGADADAITADQGFAGPDGDANTADVSPDSQDVGPDSPDVGPNSQDVSPNSQDVSLKDQDVSLKDQDVGLDSQDVGPKGGDADAVASDVVSDPCAGKVADGTVCGDGQICLSAQCVAWPKCVVGTSKVGFCKLGL